jgi:transposase
MGNAPDSPGAWNQPEHGKGIYRGGRLDVDRQPVRHKRLDGEQIWLKERLIRHRGNADVIRQELAAEKGILVSLRTIERAVRPYRRELAAEARATTRFETAPGKQLQIDFGERLVTIAEARIKTFLFVATLGYSRRLHVRAFRNERQESWFEGVESAFVKFGGVPEEVLFDNARALVVEHDAVTRHVVFNDKLLAFAKHWGFRPRACAPYRARTKGKTENGVGYVKNNAVAGRSFPSWEAFEAHLDAWTREVAEMRIHGTTGEAPLARFRREEAKALKPITPRTHPAGWLRLRDRDRRQCLLGAMAVDRRERAGSGHSPLRTGSSRRARDCHACRAERPPPAIDRSGALRRRGRGERPSGNHLPAPAVVRRSTGAAAVTR